jgi:hypothetical protein
MTHEDSTIQELERDLRALAVAQPEDEQLRVALRGRLAPSPPTTRRRWPSLRFTLPIAAGIAAATAAVFIALIGSSGTGGPTAADAAIIHRTLAAVTAPPNTILHEKTIDVSNGTSFVGEWWQQTRPPYANRGLKGQTGHVGEFADNGTTSYTYDPSTNTIYQHPDTSAPTFTDPVSLTRQQLANGQATVSGNTTINGQSLYGIRLASGITVYVDQGNYIPRYIDDPQRNGGGTLRFKVVTYQYLPATPQNLQLLSIKDQHPGATIDTNPQDWPAAINK